jgi:pseudaminic acid cytidylyltransferase
MLNVCVIPARGGSKRIPRKNIREFHGRPILAYSILAAIESGCFDRILVSTDDQQIASVARKWGAETPFTRPKAASDDHATTLDVIQHFIGWAQANALAIGNICCIYPTAPFLDPTDLKEALNILKTPKTQYVISCSDYAYPIQRALHLDNEQRLSMFESSHANTRSQDLVPAFHDAGQFYWGTESAFRLGLPFFAPHSKAFLIPRARALDIDTEEDWKFAEILWSGTSSKKNESCN